MLPIDQRQAASSREERQPEPQDDKDLLVHHVERQHAQRVVGLNGAGRTERVNRAFGHFRKQPGHGVDPVARVLFRNQRGHQGPVPPELTLQKPVQQIYLSYLMIKSFVY